MRVSRHETLGQQAEERLDDEDAYDEKPKGREAGLGGRARM